jgi:hypothetical protein
LHRYAIQHEHALGPAAAVAQHADFDAPAEVSLAELALAELGLAGIFRLTVLFELFFELFFELVVVRFGRWELLAWITADRRCARHAAADAGFATEHGYDQLGRDARRAGQDRRDQ